MKPDNEAAIDFLRKWAPNGPWVLTAIQTDRKKIATQTFRPSMMDDLKAWLLGFNGHRNIYFHVNPPRHDITKKAEREDILSMDWLHVDIDPRAGEDIEEEQARALALLTTKLPASVPPPTVVVHSGGGYQGFWKLDKPVPVNGELPLAEDAKRYNQQLELLFGADNCHNIDRIMRLPGTVNIPDAKKLKKGRTPALAKLVSFDESRVYPISAFTAAPAIQLAGITGFSSGETVQISGNIPRVEDVAELDQWSVPDRTKVIIVQGSHPDEPKTGDNSRSAWVFDVCCSLVRCDVPDEVIFSILTDPDFGISESILDKAPNGDKYAVRQIERAKEHTVSPHLRDMNEKHAVIGNMGGKCRVVEETWDGSLKRFKLTRQSFDDLRNRYMNTLVQIGTDAKGNPIMKPKGKFWLEHPQRRQFETITFSPGKEAPGSYNMWKGFAVPSKPGDCSLFLTHVKDNVCSGDEEIYQYLIKWVARAVQKPDSPGEVAVVLRGGRGTGKSIFAKMVGRLFGRHFMHVSNANHLIGQFNSHLRDVVFLFADEAFYAGDKRHASTLKTLITEDTITIEAKGVDAETSPNYVHLVLASNDRHVIPAGGDERRFLVLEVGKAQQQNATYFAALTKQMEEEGGLEALLHHLMTVDLSGFQVRDVPKTDALQEQKLLSLSPEEEWWYQKLLEGRLIQSHEGWEREIRKDELVNDYVYYAERFRVSYRGNGTALGRFLRQVCPRITDIQKMAAWEETSADGWTKKVQRRAYFYQLPDLATARAKWDELYGAEKWDRAMDLQTPAQTDTEPPF